MYSYEYYVFIQILCIYTNIINIFIFKKKIEIFLITYLLIIPYNKLTTYLKFNYNYNYNEFNSS
jgi:hypothetical protein